MYDLAGVHMREYNITKIQTLTAPHIIQKDPY